MPDRLVVYEASDGWRWRRVAGNNRRLCTGEAHTREPDAWRAAHRSCPDLDPDWTPVVDVDTSSLDLLGQLLDPDADLDRDAVRAEIEGRLT